MQKESMQKIILNLISYVLSMNYILINTKTQKVWKAFWFQLAVR